MKRTDQNLFRKLSLVVVAIFMVSAVWAQQSITGTVIDEAGETLPGVAVVVQGTSQGTVTNMDGVYTLEASADAVLLFSFVGMKTITEPVNGRANINVTMQVDAIGIEEVVTVGYGVQKKATLTGSVGNVKAEELTSRPVANTTELLQGRVSGLYTRQSSGLPGADGSSLNIRGYGSPLVLIDGIAGSMGHVDPNDIESISVLKDASAAVYGARAGNGVILVTTKRGSSGKAKITYHGSVSMTSPTYLPDIVNAQKWAELMDEAGLNPDDYSPNHVHYDPETKTLTNTMDGSEYHGYNWDEELYKDWTPQHQHNVSARGGNDKVKYFLSVGFVDQTSNFRSGDYNYNRYNVRSNIDAQITKDISVGFDMSYRQRHIDKANFDLGAMYNSLQTAKPVYPLTHEADPSRAAASGFLQRSPYHQTYKDFSGFRDEKNNVIQGGLELKWDMSFVDGLYSKFRFNYEQTFSWNKRVSKPYDVWEYDPVAADAGEDPWIKWGTQNSNNMGVTSGRVTELLPQLTIGYKQSWGEHNLNAILVGESWTWQTTSMWGGRKDLLSFTAPYLSFASEEGIDNSESLRERARNSIIGRVNYDYAGKYMLELAMRGDASAEYPEEGRWGYFPSISAGWRISEESFIKDNWESVDNLKLRASYGVLGNDNTSQFDYLTGYNISTNYYVFGSSPAPVISSAGLANPDITWESMTMYNLGLDGNLWNGLLGFEMDAFYRLKEDILGYQDVGVPSTFGASMPRTNLNSSDNRGFELTLNHVNTVGKITYDVALIYAWSRGKFVEWEEDVMPTSGEDLTEEDIEWNTRWNNRYVREGQWNDRIWGYQNDGFFMNQEQIDNHPIDQDQSGNSTLKVGDLIYKDINGDNYIDWRDEQIIGKSGLPKSMYSLDMGVKYEGWSLRMFFQGGANYTVTFAGSAAAPFSNESVPLSQHYDYRAIIGQDENGMDYITNPDQFQLPNVTQNGRTANNSKSSDFWRYDTAYFRLKNLNLSYAIPHSALKKTGIADCLLYFSGTNLWSISNLGIWKDNFDPEVTGANNADYPPVKTLTFGLKLTL